MSGENKQLQSRYDDRGIFIVGCPRSGTTLLRMILDAHPALASPEETFFLADFERLFSKYWEHLSAFGFSEETVKQMVREFYLRFHHQFCKEVGKHRWVEKTPQYLFHLRFVNDLFPNSKIVHIIRDGRDVAASFKEKWDTRGFYRSLDLWPKSICAGQEAANWLPPAQYLLLKYEDLIMQPEKVLRQLCTFLDIEWNDALLQHYQFRHSTIQSFGADRPVSPLTTTSAGSWRRRLNPWERLLVTLCFRQRLWNHGYISRKPLSSSSAAFFERWLSLLGELISRGVGRLTKRTTS